MIYLSYTFNYQINSPQISWMRRRVCTLSGWPAAAPACATAELYELISSRELNADVDRRARLFTRVVVIDDDDDDDEQLAAVFVALPVAAAVADSDDDVAADNDIDDWALK